MHVIDADFELLSEVPVSELFGFAGTYVLWDGQAQVKPSYIGEGNILKRIVDHSRDYATPLNGYIAVLGKASRARAKRDAEILETVLLEAAAETRRSPPNNSQSGSLRGITSLFRRHGVIRVNLTGYNPLSPPRLRRFFDERKEIRLIEDESGNIFMSHPWKSRHGG